MGAHRVVVEGLVRLVLCSPVRGGEGGRGGVGGRAAVGDVAGEDDVAHCVGGAGSPCGRANIVSKDVARPGYPSVRVRVNVHDRLGGVCLLERRVVEDDWGEGPVVVSKARELVGRVARVREIHDVVDLGELDFAQLRGRVGRRNLKDRLCYPAACGEVGGECSGGVGGGAVVGDAGFAHIVADRVDVAGCPCAGSGHGHGCAGRPAPEPHVAHAHFDDEAGGGAEVEPDEADLAEVGVERRAAKLRAGASDDAAVGEDLKVLQRAAGAAVFLQTRPSVDEGGDFTGVEGGVEIELRHLILNPICVRLARSRPWHWR